MSFTTPLALVLLVALPIVIYLGWPRLRYRRSRDTISLILRGLILILLVLALAGAQWVQSANKLAVVFLMDVSDSVGQAAQESQIEFIRQSLQSMSPDDEASVVLFGANALVERPLSAVRELPDIRSIPVTSNTDIAEAIRLGLVLFPTDAARRMVILSDGRPTVGDTQAAAQLAAAAGVEISYVPVSREAAPEVQVSDVRVPSTVNAGQQFDLSMTIEAEEATPATITVLASGEVIQRQDVNLSAGTNNYTLTLEGGEAGFKDFRVQVEPANAYDGFYQNNQLSAFSRVVGPPRTLLVSSSPQEINYLLPALEQSGLTVDQVTPETLPIGLAPLAQYNSIILANVSAAELSPRRMQVLQTFVRDLGGGLVVIGGPDTYGPGGYFQTPLEETLPIEMQIRDQQRIPQLTIAYVIDRSGSMGEVGPSGVSNLELAKEAINRSIDFLQPTDRAGIVSFDSAGYWIADIQPVFDRFVLQQLVASISSGGGTDILAGMSLVATTIVDDPSTRKHIILLTDGGANPMGLVELSEKLYQENDITTSVIAIGSGSAPFLQDMANAGGGNYHAVTVVENIPTIFTLETVLATRSYILEQSFVPTLTANSPIMQGINAAPPLLGYVAATPKDTAQVILRGPEPYNDPILASWQYGLGRAVAFTSDATSRWGANWVNWDDFSRFWSQAVRWTITEGANNNLETRVVMEGEQARLVVDARDDDGAFLNGLDLGVSVIDPELEAERIQLRQVAPGRYEATFTPSAEGAYFLGIAGEGQAGEQTINVNQTTGWVMSYSPEYNLRAEGADTALLDDLAFLTNGRSFNDNPAGVFTHDLVARNASLPLYPWLLLIALLLLPLDIAVRRLVITRSDLQRVREAVFKRAPVVEAPSERISTLMGAKARAQQQTQQGQPESAPQPANTAAALRGRREQSRAERAAQPVQTPATTQNDAPRFTPPASSGGATKPQGNVAGELLKKRKGREENEG
jgi:uncharacterized membrane protein